MTLANAPIIFKVGLQGLTAQSTIEAELEAAALTMKEGAIFFSNMMLELDFDKSFRSVPLYIDNTLALHVVSNRTYSPRAKHIALRCYFLVQELVEGKISIHYVKSEDQLADLRTKHHSKHRHRDLIKLINYQGKAIIFLREEYLRIAHIIKPSSFCVRNTCVLLTLLVVIYRGARTLHYSFLAGSSH